MSRVSLMMAAVFATVAVVQVAASDRTITANGFAVDFVGQSGKVLAPSPAAAPARHAVC
jgi:hypothetical protein